jgi:hypothetical protein
MKKKKYELIEFIKWFFKIIFISKIYQFIFLIYYIFFKNIKF